MASAGGVDWHRLVVPASAEAGRDITTQAIRARPVAVVPQMQAHRTAAAPYFSQASTAAAAAAPTVQSRHSTPATPTHRATTAVTHAHKATAAGSSVAERRALSSSQPPSSGPYSPSSPRPHAPRHPLSEAHTSATSAPKKRSTAQDHPTKVAAPSPEATARASLARKLSSSRQSSHAQQPAITTSAKVAPSSSTATARADQVPEKRALSSERLEGGSRRSNIL